MSRCDSRGRGQQAQSRPSSPARSCSAPPTPSASRRCTSRCARSARSPLRGSAACPGCCRRNRVTRWRVSYAVTGHDATRARELRSHHAAARRDALALPLRARDPGRRHDLAVRRARAALVSAGAGDAPGGGAPDRARARGGAGVAQLRRARACSRTARAGRLPERRSTPTPPSRVRLTPPCGRGTWRTPRRRARSSVATPSSTGSRSSSARSTRARRRCSSRARSASASRRSGTRDCCRRRPLAASACCAAGPASARPSWPTRRSAICSPTCPRRPWRGCRRHSATRSTSRCCAPSRRPASSRCSAPSASGCSGCCARWPRTPDARRDRRRPLARPRLRERARASWRGGSATSGSASSACGAAAGRDVPLGLDRALPDGRFERLALGGLDAEALDLLLRTQPGHAAIAPDGCAHPARDRRQPLLRARDRPGAGRAQRPPGARPTSCPSRPSLQELVRERLELLPAPARAAAQVAAALSRPTVAIVDAALTPGGARRGRRGRRPRARRGTPRVRAPAARHGRLPAALATRERRALHARLAEILEDPEERARHLALAAEAPDEGVAAALERRRAARCGARRAGGGRRAAAAGGRAHPGRRRRRAAAARDRGGRALLRGGRGRARARAARARSSPSRRTARAAPRRSRGSAGCVPTRRASTPAPTSSSPRWPSRRTTSGCASRSSPGLAWCLHSTRTVPSAAEHARAALELAEELGDPDACSRARSR